MDVKGRLVKKLPLESGTSKAGKEWKKQTVIVETAEEFNNTVAVSAFGDDKIKQLDKLEEGMVVSILCNVYSREYNGKYYHNIDGYWFSNQSNSSDTMVTSDDDFEKDMPF
tara:strand:- start:3367 stop:3699 length:333 start_codon:yes stop_codon:yes gene_type:complete